MSGVGLESYDLVILDLDGVVYLGDQAIPHAAESISARHAAGGRVAFVTNNASRRAAQVADLLTSMGVPASAEEVVTAAQVAAEAIAADVPPGSPVLVVGADALREEIAEVGLRPVDRAEDHPAAVVQGYAPAMGWVQLAEACVAVRAGASWVATNTDRTLPSPRGELPGNGAMVAALAAALDRQPDLVVGKPQPTLFRRAAERTGARRALVVGDRLDTDIEGARNAGMDSLLVLTGVAGAADLLHAPPQQRPTYVACDLTALRDGSVGPPLDRVDPRRTGGWSVTRDTHGLRLDGDGDPLDALRALCAATWAADQPDAAVVSGSPAAARALKDLRLAG